LPSLPGDPASPEEEKGERTVIDLSGLVLMHGVHKKDNDECCIMEAESVLACAVRDPSPPATWPEAIARFRHCKTDTPDDASWAIAGTLRRLNDWMTDEERPALVPYALKVIGSRGSRDVEIRRAVAAANYAIHEAAPRALDYAKKPDLANRLRAIPQIVDRASAESARDEARAVRSAAYADAYAAAYADAAADAAADAYAADAYAADAYAADAAVQRSFSTRIDDPGTVSQLISASRRLYAMRPPGTCSHHSETPIERTIVDALAVLP
jgi:hypothetical protein